MKELPILDAVLIDGDETKGLKFISFVKNPAIMVNWVQLSEQEKPVKLAIQNEERRIVFAPVLIPDLPIYRNVEGQEFYMRFGREVIEKTAIKFAKDNLLSSIDLNHDNLKVDGVTFFQLFLTDENTVPTVKGFESLPIGTYFAAAKVENDDVWNLIKEGKVSGFSIDGLFKFEMSETITDAEIEAIIDEVIK